MSKTGHAKNVAEFETLVNFVITLGEIYQPANEELNTTNLNVKLISAKESLAQIQTDFANWKDVTNRREMVFEASEKLLLRAVNSFAVSGADKLDVEDAKSFVRKTQGRRAAAKPEPETPGEAIKTNAIAQTSYDNKVEHFAQIVSILENNTSYNPNETDLKTEALSTVLADLRSKNTAVINANISLSNARLSRNQILYNPTKGLVQKALDVKTYVKSIFGASSLQYKQISGLQFKNVAK